MHRTFNTQWFNMIVLIAISMGLFLGCGGASNSLIQGNAPDFKLPVANQPDSLSLSESEGKVRLLVFWATWCTPCLAEIPTLNKLQTELGPQGLQILGINLDEEPRETLGSILQKMNIQYPILLGGQTEVKAYGNFSGVPTSFLVSRTGKLLELMSGYTEEGMLRNRIEVALRQSLVDTLTPSPVMPRTN